MINNQSGKIYTMIIPDSTTDDVILWFDLMESKGILTSSLIELVYDHIRKFSHFIEIADSKIKDYEEPLSDRVLESNDLLNNLYNYSESKSECFDEKNKKDRRKMLCI